MTLALRGYTRELTVGGYMGINKFLEKQSVEWLKAHYETRKLANGAPLITPEMTNEEIQERLNKSGFLYGADATRDDIAELRGITMSDLEEALTAKGIKVP